MFWICQDVFKKIKTTDNLSEITCMALIGKKDFQNTWKNGNGKPFHETTLINKYLK